MFISVEGILDNMPHWYPLREHDVTTGVELPKPTVLPADIRGALDLQRRGSPNLYCNSQGSPKPNRQQKVYNNNNNNNNNNNDNYLCYFLYFFRFKILYLRIKTFSVTCRY